MGISDETLSWTSNIHVFYFWEKKKYYDLYKCDCCSFVKLGIKPAETVNIA